MPKVDRQRHGAKNGTIVKLNFNRPISRVKLPVFLQTGDSIQERRISPWLKRPLRMFGGDDIGSRLFHDAEPVELQLTNNRCFSGARRASDDEPSHCPAEAAQRIAAN